MKMYEPDTFLYYSYGANLLTSRIHMHNPTAEFLSIARLDVSSIKLPSSLSIYYIKLLVIILLQLMSLPGVKIKSS